MHPGISRVAIVFLVLNTNPIVGECHHPILLIPLVPSLLLVVPIPIIHRDTLEAGKCWE